MNKNLHKTLRLYSPLPLRIDHEIRLEGPAHHYIRNVMRQNEGDIIRLFHTDSGEFAARITQIHKKYVSVLPQEELRPAYTPQADKPRLTLAFAPLPKDRMDMLIEKAVELGVHHLQPVICDHSNVRRLKNERIEAQIIEAAEQCERMDIPALESPISSDTFLRQNDTQIITALERHNTQPLSNHLSAPPLESAGSIAYFIGPEGGFSDRERDLILQCENVYAASLGPRILRAETAGFYGLSLISAHYDM